MNKIILSATTFIVTAFASTANATLKNTILKGSGAPFSAPLMLRWADDFNNEKHGITVKYQSDANDTIAKKFVEGDADFAVRINALTDEQSSKLGGNFLSLPISAAPIVVAYNIPDVASGLKLSRKAYTGIFLGSVTNWNDASIASDNPGLSLPDLPISLVIYAGNNGTTSAFSSHLAAISPEFAKKIGDGADIKWAGALHADNSGEAALLIKKTPGSIGYMQLGYAENSMNVESAKMIGDYMKPQKYDYNERLSVASLQNKTGNFIPPSISSQIYALAAKTLSEDLSNFPQDPEGADDYPIVTFTYLLVKKSYADKGKAEALRAFFNYALSRGQDRSADLGYIPLPPSGIKKDQSALDTIN